VIGLAKRTSGLRATPPAMQNVFWLIFLYSVLFLTAKVTILSQNKHFSCLFTGKPY
jgi:hypothetical protein